MIQLISASSSPYSRKVRIVLAEKGIPFELVSEVPWDSTTQTPKYNPLEKVPVLVLEDGTSVYESHYIVEYLETKFPKESLLANDTDEKLFAKKVEVVADGVCDACGLLFLEKQRANPSPEWKARQLRKAEGGIKALAEWADNKNFIVGDKFGLADVVVGVACGYADLRLSEFPWRTRYPSLAKYVDQLSERQSFKDTVPFIQKAKDKIL